MGDWLPRRNRLAGKHVIVRAEVPHFEGLHDQPTSPVLETEEAVTSLVRAIVVEGGAMTLIGNASLALLAGIVSGEYVEPHLEDHRERRRPLLSLVIGPAKQQEEDPFRRLVELGYVQVDRAESFSAAVTESASSAAAMICVGTGAPEEVSAFREANRTDASVFVFRATLDLTYNTEKLGDVEMVDVIVERSAPLPRAELDRPFDDIDFESPLPPMALSAQWIVERLIEGTKRKIERR